MTSSDKRFYILLAVFISLVLLCIISCLVTALTVVFVLDMYAEAEPFEYISKARVAIDTDPLPRRPTETDWYPIAVQALEDSNWDLSPNLTQISTSFPCQSDVVLDRLEMHFSDSYFSGVIPHLKVATVSLDRAKDTAYVKIGDEASRWRHSPMDLSLMQVGFYEAVEIAERYAGKAFRQGVNDGCEVWVLGAGYKWRVRYSGKDRQVPVPDLKIEVSAKSGEVKRLP